MPSRRQTLHLIGTSALAVSLSGIGAFAASSPQRETLTMSKILFIATSADRMIPHDEPTGVWLEELTTPYYTFTDAGAAVTVASIAGGPIPVDARSLAAPGENEASVERYLADQELQSAVAKSLAFANLDAYGYDALFLPGGHGTMFDHPGNAELARIVERFDASGRIVAAVCHGPAGLVSARKADGRPFVAGRKVAAFTDSEERAVGLDDEMPFLLETRMRELGADFQLAENFAPFAVRDRNLVTGQNPASARPVAALVMEALAETAD